MICTIKRGEVGAWIGNEGVRRCTILWMMSSQDFSVDIPVCLCVGNDESQIGVCVDDVRNCG